MFKEILQSVVDGTEGAIAGVIMDFQGCSVDTYTKDDASLEMMERVGAEFSVVVKSIQRAAESLEAGGASEVAICADKITTVIRVVNQDYFMAVALAPAGNLGKARYLMRTSSHKVLALL